MSKRCPITYEPIPPIPKEAKYSQKGLKLLSPSLKNLEDLPYSAEEQRIEARMRAHKISIQGVQPKLSARLSAVEGRFEIVDIGGKFILKPQNGVYPELPENEDVTMRMASAAGIETPLHGLVYSKDGSKTYFIRRFDRAGHRDKVPLEDFAQLAGKTRETKYNFSMERLVPILDAHCTFPLLDKKRLFERTMFNFLVGNEDMHLKNFSLITREGRVELAPAYDFLNSTIALGRTEEEIALPLSGRKRKLRRKELVDDFGRSVLGLNESTVEEVLRRLSQSLPAWREAIEICFLSEQAKAAYLSLLEKRRSVIGL